MIPLSRIRPSDRNVRKTKNGQTLEQLADNILAYDILQNIVVEPVKKPRGHFAVVAGDRRYAAAHILVGRGDWKADRDIPALVVNGTGQHLSAISLAENFQREAMSAADECLGFQTIIVDEGGDAATIAKRFGIKKRFVDGRLRLASLAAPIFAALAEGKMTLEVAEAYASTDNQDKQLRVFETYGVGNHGYGSGPDAIRRQIAMGSMRGDDPVALLVTEPAYVDAGGRIERDLFTEKADDRWIDPEIADRLAGALLEAEAVRLAEDSGLAWIRPIASTDTWSARGDLYIVNLPPAPPTLPRPALPASGTSMFRARAARWRHRRPSSAPAIAPVRCIARPRSTASSRGTCPASSSRSMTTMAARSRASIPRAGRNSTARLPMASPSRLQGRANRLSGGLARWSAEPFQAFVFTQFRMNRLFRNSSRTT